MALPEDWVIQKTDLFKRFGRSTVSHAFDELEQTGFLVSMKFRDGQRNAWGYAVSDVEFNIEQIVEMIIETELPLLEVKSRFEFEQIFETLNSRTPENVGISTFSQVLNFNTSDSTVERQLFRIDTY